MASRGGSLCACEERVLRDITRCRTAALGGHVEKCDRCSHLEISYNSCRNRHCPKCQATARKKWLSERQGELLPVEYFHLVFTVPHELSSITFQNKKALYDILFRASAEALQEIALDPKHLGAEVGFLSVLHTWGRSLEHHPHVHVIVPGGGLSSDRKAWIPSRHQFFLPVKPLGRLFRGKFLAALKRAHREGVLSFEDSLTHLHDEKTFAGYLSPLYERDWFVYSKAPFGGPEHVLRYLSRYTHRVAISNGRLVSLKQGQVSFLWKDYAHQCKKRVMTLSAVEFLRRFLTHVLPSGFVRIRHYGFLANRCRAAMIQLSRELLNQTKPTAMTERLDPVEPAEDAPTRCPACKCGRMVIVLKFDAGEAVPEHLAVAIADTS